MNLKQYLRAIGMSQSELADRVGVTQATVSRWTTEQTTPTREHLSALAETIDYQPSQSVLLDLSTIVPPSRKIAPRDLVELIDALRAVQAGLWYS